MTKLLQFISQVKIYVPFQVYNKPFANGKKKEYLNKQNGKFGASGIKE